MLNLGASVYRHQEGCLLENRGYGLTWLTYHLALLAAHFPEVLDFIWKNGLVHCETVSSKVRQTQLQITASYSLTMTLGKLLSPTNPQFPDLKNGRKEETCFEQFNKNIFQLGRIVG